MIWFLLGVLPLAALFIWGFIWGLMIAPVPVLIATAIAVGLIGCVTLGMYGAYDMGWIMQCGGDSFWTAEDC